jgi:universal stress protein F
MVPMYKHILAALDGSPRAPQVLRHAADLAALWGARTGARLHLCHAVNVPLGLPADTWTLTGEELTGRLVDHGLHELTRLAEGLQPTYTPVLWGERVCRLGRPAQVIVDVAEELQADLIIIGSHGYDTLDRILGTTAARVVNHARCSVLVIKPDVVRPDATP